jgi:HlyD family secretion protein
MIIRYVLPLLAMVSFTFAILQMAKAQKPAPAVTPPVEPSRSPYANTLVGAGLVEPETENIAIGTPLPGIVDRVMVAPGQVVRSGDLLFKLDDRQLKAELAIRKANLNSAQATMNKLKKMPREEEVPPYRAKLMEAQANLDDSQQMYDRLKRLSVAAASEEDLKKREMAVAIAKAQVARAKGDLDLIQKGAWEYDVAVAQATIDAAAAQIGQTEMELERIQIRAPRRNWPDANSTTPMKDETEYKVLQVNIRPGEYVGAAPGTALIVLGCVGKLHVRVDIDENEITRFTTGLEGTAKPRGNPKQEFAIKFVRVEPYVIPKKSLTGGNTERVDTRVLQVVYALDTKDQVLYVGQQMDVFLNTANKKEATSPSSSGPTP